MADDQLETVYWNVHEETFASLTDELEVSYWNSGTSDEALIRLEQYLNAVLEVNELVSSEIQNPAVRDELVAILMDNLVVGDDRQIEQAIRDKLDNLAAQKAVVTTDPAQHQRHQAADPVDMFSGQFVHEVEDIFINGAGMDFVFRRAYKHQAKYWGPLGAKWDHNYNLWIRQIGTSVIRSTGHLREDMYTRHPKFGQAGFDYWVPPPGSHGVVEERGTPQGVSFVWRSPDGVKCFYKPDPSNPLIHLVEQIEDRFGNYLAFDYYPRESGRLLAAVVNHPERVVVFEYDSQGRIQYIRDYVGRTWCYSYDDFGDLIAFTLPATDQHPAGSTTWYEYTSSTHTGNLQHNLARIVDPAGRVYVENEYGTAAGLLSHNKVVRQRLANGESYFEYEQVVHEFDHAYTDSEAPWRQVNFVERNGHPIHYVYNKFGNLLLKEEHVLEDGRLRSLQWRYRYNRDGALIGVLSPEGRITQYYYGRDHYLRVHLITDEEVPEHDSLISQERLAFDNLLAMVRRSKPYTFEMMNLNKGVWGNFFPDFFANDSDDVVTKYTYEPYYQQIRTTSDPRYTQQADPGYAEMPAYFATLTHHEYDGPIKDPHRFLVRIQYPDLTLPDGTVVPGATQEFSDYDSRGRLRRQVDQVGIVTNTIYFRAADGVKEGFVKKKTVESGDLAVTTEFEVNNVGVVVAIHHPRSVGAVGGRFVTRFDVDDRNQVVRTHASSPFSYVTESHFDPSGLVERVERNILDERGNQILGGIEVQLFSYGEQKEMEREVIGGNDAATQYATMHRYDETDRLVATFSSAGGVVRRRYDARLLQRAVIRGSGSPEASTAEAKFDGDGRKSGMTSGLGVDTTFQYDPLGRINVIKDAMGNLTRLTHDKAGNIITRRFFERRADGSFAMLSRSEYVFDELNRRIRDGYNLFLRPLPVADTRTVHLASPGPGVLLKTEYYYDAKGRLIRTVNPKGQSTYAEYDAFDRKIVEMNDLDDRIETLYDGHGNVTRRDTFENIINPATGTVTGKELFSATFDYDELDRVSATTDSIGNVTRYAYDSRNNVARITDPLGNVIRYEYDIHNRKVSEIRELTDTGLGGSAVVGTTVTRFQYDENGNLTAQIDGNGNRIEQVFDALDRRTTVVYLDGSTHRTEYDADDNIVSIEDNNKLVRRFTNDALGRTLRVDVDRSGMAAGVLVEGEDFEQYTYDALGRTLSEVNDFADVQKKVDSLGRVFEESVAFISPAMTGAPRSLQRQHDEVGNIHKLVYSDNRVIQYDRDALNRLVVITNIAKGTAYPGSNTFSDPHEVLHVDHRGQRPIRLRYGNGAGTGYQYDAMGRLIHIEHIDAGGTQLLAMQQLHDSAGNIRFRNDIDPLGTVGERFEYDSVYRLTRVKPDTISAINAATFRPGIPPPLDPIPNRQAAIDALLGPLAQDHANSTFAYDAAANRTREQQPGQPPVTYVANRLNEYRNVNAVTLTYDRNGNLITEGARQYFYDARNLLIRVHDTALGVDIVRYSHDCSGRRIAEVRNGHVIHLLWDALNAIEEYEDGVLHAQYVHEGATDAICQMALGGSEFWFHKDPIESTRLLTDNTGALAGRHRFDPFGIMTYDSVPLNRVCFTGRRYDREISMYDFRAREYASVTGRFVQRDPKGIGGAYNIYEYAQDNPLRFVDPLGTEPVEFINAQRPNRYMSLGDVEDSFRGVIPTKKGLAVSNIWASIGSIIDELATFFPVIMESRGYYDSPQFIRNEAGIFVKESIRRRPMTDFGKLGSPGLMAGGAVLFALANIKGTELQLDPETRKEGLWLEGIGAYGGLGTTFAAPILSGMAFMAASSVPAWVVSLAVLGAYFSGYSVGTYLDNIFYSGYFKDMRDRMDENEMRGTSPAQLMEAGSTYMENREFPLSMGMEVLHHNYEVGKRREQQDPVPIPPHVYISP